MRNYFEIESNQKLWEDLNEEWVQGRVQNAENSIDHFQFLYRIYIKIKSLDNVGKHSRIDITLASLNTDAQLINNWKTLSEEGCFKDASGVDWKLPKSKNFQNFERLLNMVSSNITSPDTQVAIGVVNQILGQVINETISSQIDSIKAQKQQELQNKIDSSNHATNHAIQMVLSFLVIFVILYLFFWVMENSGSVDCSIQNCEEYYQDNNYYQDVVRPG